jgi:hypothetical protein
MLSTQAINADRASRGLKEVHATHLYKDEYRPDWWPVGEYSSAAAFDKKEDTVKVYNAARQVLAAMKGVKLESDASPKIVGGGGKDEKKKKKKKTKDREEN